MRVNAWHPEPVTTNSRTDKGKNRRRSMIVAQWAAPNATAKEDRREDVFSSQSLSLKCMSKIMVSLSGPANFATE